MLWQLTAAADKRARRLKIRCRASGVWVPLPPSAPNGGLVDEAPPRALANRDTCTLRVRDLHVITRLRLSSWGIGMPTYNEQVMVFIEGRAEPIRCYINGRSWQRRGGLGGWRATLTGVGPEAVGALWVESAGKSVTVEFDDGATGRALIQSVRLSSSGGSTATLVGNGVPPRVSAR